MKFTEENLKKLNDLTIELLFANAKFVSPIFNAGSLNVYQLVNETDIQTLKSFYSALESQLAKLNKTNKWDHNSQDDEKTQTQQKWLDFIDNLIGFKLNKEHQAEVERKERKEKVEKLKLLKAIREEKKLDKIKSSDLGELDKMIEELEK